MRRTFIVCGDTVFLRMLELELSDGFFGVITAFDSYAAFNGIIGKYGIPEDDGAACVFDLDTEDAEKEKQRTAEIVAEYGVFAAFFGRGERQFYKNTFDGDFLRRPFDIQHLKQILSALPRFSYAAQTRYPDYEPADDIKLNERTSSAYFRGEYLPLTVKEYKLLSYLMRMRGSTVGREEIAAEAWDGKNAGRSNTVDVYIRFLRSKIDDKYGVRLIHSVRGSGYRIN